MKNMKILLLSFSLVASLTITSHAKDTKKMVFRSFKNISNDNTKEEVNDTTNKEAEKKRIFQTFKNISNDNTKEEVNNTTNKEAEKKRIFRSFKNISNDNTKEINDTTNKEAEKKILFQPSKNISNDNTKEINDTTNKEAEKKILFQPSKNISNDNTKEINDTTNKEVDKFSYIKDFYNKIMQNLEQETKKRTYIKKRLDIFNNLCYKYFNSYRKLNDNMSITNTNLNLLQNILLEYYEFALSMSKYTEFINILSLDTPRIKKIIKNENFCITFMPKYDEFIRSIDTALKNIKKLNNFVLLSNFTEPKENDFNILDITDENYDSLNKITRKILYLNSKFKKIFERIKIDMDSDLWKDTKFKNKNKLIDENFDLKDLEINPETQSTCYLVDGQFTNAVPPHYRINLDVLATTVKLDLLKSLNFLKTLKNSELNNSGLNFITPFDLNRAIKNSETYKKVYTYANILYRFYNTLRCLMVASQKSLQHSSIPYFSNENVKRTLSSIFSTNTDFNETLKRYIEDKNNSHDVVSSRSALKLENRKPTDLKNNVFVIYYMNKHKIQSVSAFYNHIQNNEELYTQLMNSAKNNSNSNLFNTPVPTIGILDKFFFKLDGENFSVLKNEDDNNNLNIPDEDENNNLNNTYNDLPNLNYLQQLNNSFLSNIPYRFNRYPDLNTFNPEFTSRSMLNLNPNVNSRNNPFPFNSNLNQNDDDLFLNPLNTFNPGNTNRSMLNLNPNVNSRNNPFPFNSNLNQNNYPNLNQNAMQTNLLKRKTSRDKE